MNKLTNLFSSQKSKQNEEPEPEPEPEPTDTTNKEKTKPKKDNTYVRPKRTKRHGELP